MRGLQKFSGAGQEGSASLCCDGDCAAPWEKPTYVCELSPTDGGHLYQFSYRIAGIMTDAPRPNDTIRFDWGSGCCGHDCYPYGAPDFPEPNFDVMFFAELPWILDEASGL